MFLLKSILKIATKVLHSKYLIYFLFFGIAVIMFIYTGALFEHAFYIQSIGSGIGSYNGFLSFPFFAMLLLTTIVFYFLYGISSNNEFSKIDFDTTSENDEEEGMNSFKVSGMYQGVLTVKRDPFSLTPITEIGLLDNGKTFDFYIINEKLLTGEALFKEIFKTLLRDEIFNDELPDYDIKMLVASPFPNYETKDVYFKPYHPSQEPSPAIVLGRDGFFLRRWITLLDSVIHLK
uniref:Uncharacterized protein n=1 Tax=Phanerochaete carnosa TaxID=231932 RepID=A0A895KV62_9APHY|nr:hypothetical protein K8K84_mgp035 [Phanerochaete carnosa]QRZ60417.1 hypothetical protein [Phanerochaete carnosa]